MTSAHPSYDEKGLAVNPQIQQGSVLGGKYQVERVLGQGGIGMVLAARHLELEERVAIKLLLPEHASNADVVARFMREGKAAIKIRSEHVARVIDVGRFDDGAPFLVMEYLDGSDLSELIVRRGQLPLDIAVLYLLQACEALAEAHALGIVHRDLKPANLFLTTRVDGSPCVKVLDFGISKIGGLGSGVASPQGITKTQGIMGSPLYMSPEQLNTPRDVDARADVWALGVILFELLTGSHPFTAEELAALIVQIVTQPPRSLRALRPELPAAVEAVIEKCLTKQRDARYQDVAKLAAALLPFSPHGKSSVERVQRILARPGVVGSTSGAHPAAPPAGGATLTPLGGTNPPMKASRAPLLLLLVPVLALGGVGAYFATRSPAKEAPAASHGNDESRPESDDEGKHAPEHAKKPNADPPADEATTVATTATTTAPTASSEKPEPSTTVSAAPTPVAAATSAAAKPTTNAGKPPVATSKPVSPAPTLSPKKPPAAATSDDAFGGHY